MKTLRPLSIALLLCSVSLCRTAHAVSADDQAARAVAVRWLALLDAGHYRQAFEEMPPRMKAASLGVDHFVKACSAQRGAFGQAKSRTYYKISAYKAANGWPDGNYQQIIFKSSFDHKAIGWEKVIMTKETGHWQVGNYFFK